MAGRGPRAPWHDGGRGAPRDAPADASRTAPDATRTVAHGTPTAPDAVPGLVRISDHTGRPRGAGFVADHHGTVVTGHEAVDGLSRLVLHADGDRTCTVTADAVTPLPGLGLALVRTEGLGTDPLPVTVRDGVESGRYVRLAAGCWREARVLAEASATYPAPDRPHRLDGVLELAIGTAGRDALRPGGGAAGGPVLDAGTGAVVAVLNTALRRDDRDACFAVPLRPLTGATGDRRDEKRNEPVTASPTAPTAAATAGTAATAATASATASTAASTAATAWGTWGAGRAAEELPARAGEAAWPDGVGRPGRRSRPTARRCRRREPRPKVSGHGERPRRPRRRLVPAVLRGPQRPRRPPGLRAHGRP